MQFPESKWTDNLPFFEEAVRQSFDFLCKEKGYAEPEVQYSRDFFLIYKNSSKDLQIGIGWERSWFAPFVFIQSSGGEAGLPQVLKSLRIATESRRSPLCEKLSQKKLPGIRESWTHHRHKREIRDECPRYLEGLAAALRTHYDEILGAAG